MAPKWQLTLAEEFDGPRGQAPNPKIWGRDLGASGFGNNELQRYTDGNANAFMDGKGNLIIEARREKTQGSEYTSARLITKGKWAQAYGKIEARMKLPAGKGIWPAFWMMGENIDKAGWPVCGEIDILEFIGHERTVAHGTVHGPGYSGGDGRGASFKSTTPLDLDFHVFGVEWEPERIRWFVDGKVFHTITPNEIGSSEWVFNQPFFILLNLAVGGNWPGAPDATTVFPRQLVVDYVRVYRDANLKVDTKGIAQRRKARLEKFQEYKPKGPLAIPGTLAFADFRPGGYKDADQGNIGGAYRPLEGVDIGRSGEAKVPYSVGWVSAGEWLGYDVNVATSDNYKVEVTVASEGLGGTFHLELDGKPLGGKVQVPDTGAWQKWQTIALPDVRLPAGRHSLRVVMDTDGPKTKSVGNLLALRFTRG
ncbi:MAG: family 16 glycosylhydrolase [Fimbriimonas sp.]